MMQTKEQTKIDKAPSIYVRAKINNAPLSALLDHGAEISLISQNISDFLEQSGNEKHLNLNINSATQKSDQLQKYVMLDVQLGGEVIRNVQFFISPNVASGVLLGMNVIRRGRVIVEPHPSDPRLDKVCAGKYKYDVPLSYNHHDNGIIPHVSLCHTANRVRLLPRELHFVPITVSNQIQGYEETVYVTPNMQYLNNKGLESSDTLLSNESTLKIPLYNAGDKVVYVPKGATVGEIVTVATEIVDDATEPQGLEEPSTSASKSDAELIAEISAKMESVSTNITAEQKQKFIDLFSGYLGTISKDESDLGQYTGGEHIIETEGRPIKLKSRPIPVHYRNEILKIIEKNLEQGVISPSFSPWCAPIVVAVKKNGKLRMCVDYRKLNTATKKDVYVIPRIQDILDSLSGSKYWITLDLRSGYWQIPVAESDREKTAFACEFGLFEFNVLPFGLCNAPSTFQRVMDNVLRGLKGVFVYIDDIMISGKTFEEVCERFRNVLNRLRDAQLKINLAKSQFFAPQMEFLGHEVTPEGIKPSNDKTAAIDKFPIPSNVEQVRSFYGLCSFYRSFVYRFAEIAKPLQEVTKVSKKFEWTEECQEAFETLKVKLTSKPILAYPDFDNEFTVYTDASNYALGVVLAQKQGDKEHVISYASRVMNSAERRYTISQKEALAVVFGCTKYRKYLLGRHFKLVTDHKALEALQHKQNINCDRLERWSIFLSQYDYELEYKQGKLHLNADALSRLIDIGDNNDTEGAPKRTKYYRMQVHAATQTVSNGDDVVERVTVNGNDNERHW